MSDGKEVVVFVSRPCCWKIWRAEASGEIEGRPVKVITGHSHSRARPTPECFDKLLCEDCTFYEVCIRIRHLTGE